MTGEYADPSLAPWQFMPLHMLGFSPTLPVQKILETLLQTAPFSAWYLGNELSIDFSRASFYFAVAKISIEERA